MCVYVYGEKHPNLFSLRRKINLHDKSKGVGVSEKKVLENISLNFIFGLFAILNFEGLICLDFLD